MKTKHMKIGALLTLLGLAFGIVVLRVSSTESAPQLQQGQDVPQPKEPQDEVSLKGWKYRISEDTDGGHEAVVRFDQNTVENLKTYSHVNKNLALELQAAGVTEMEVMVTFRMPITLEEFAGWAARVPIHIKWYQVRFSGNGRSGSAAISPRDGRLVPESLQADRARLEASRGLSEMEGAIVVDGRIAANDYEKLVNEPMVFLADVTRTAVIQHVERNRLDIDKTKFRVHVTPVFETMKTLGLEKFQ